MTGETRIARRRVTMLLVDGARPDVFTHLANAGDLPHISRHILEPGGTVPATTVFPSTTGVAYLPFLTGCYPGTCDVPGIRWLDVEQYRGRWWRDRDHVRNYCGYQGEQLNTDLPADMATLFDLVPDAEALCTPITRGLNHGGDPVSLERKFWGALAHYTATYQPLDRAVGRELLRLAAAPPRLIFAVLPAVDGVTHFNDPWHPAVLEMYRGVDEIVGAFAAAGGFAGEHLTLLVSDHGQQKVERHTDISVELERMGLSTLRHPLIWRRNPKVAVMVSGNASAQVYLLPGRRRDERYSVAAIEAGKLEGIPPDLVCHLAQLPGVAFVAGANGAGLTIVSRVGRASLSVTQDGRIDYRPQSADVLGFGGSAIHDDREWLRRTLHTARPDAPTQLLQLFRSSRAGDLVVVAAEGADLRRDWEIPEHRSGHGSLIAEHMRCLVASNHEIEGPVRTVDLFPLMLEYLGVPIPEGIDGVVPVRRGAK